MAAPSLENWEMTAALKDLTDWLIRQGLEDTPVETWLDACCNKLVAAGIPLQRVNLSLRAHHPEIGAVAFRWTRGGANALTINAQAMWGMNLSKARCSIW
jgi:adenylate cyclase